MATTTKVADESTEAAQTTGEPEAGPDTYGGQEAGEGLTEQPQLFETAKAADARTIHGRMAAILDELPAIGKERENTQQNFMFRGHDDVLNALNPLLGKHGVVIVPHVLERLTAHRTTGRGATMYEVNLHVQYAFWGEDGSVIHASAWGEGTDMGDKATTKAMTMAFKNVLIQAFSISTEEYAYADIDQGAAEETTAGSAADPEATKRENRRGRIGELAKDLDERTKSDPGTWKGFIESESQRAFGVSFSALSVEELEEVGKTLRAFLDSGEADVPEQLKFVVPF